MQKIVRSIIEKVALGVGVIFFTGIVCAAPPIGSDQPQSSQEQQTQVDKTEQKTLRDSLKESVKKREEEKKVKEAAKKAEEEKNVEAKEAATTTGTNVTDEKKQQEVADKEAMKKAKEEKKLQEKAAKEAAKNAEKKAIEDKKLQEKAAKEALKKAEQEKELQGKVAKEAAKKAEQEKKLQDKAAKEAEKQRLREAKQHEKEMALAEKRKKAGKPSFKEFYVYKNAGYDGNHFTPTGWMGDIEDMKFTTKSFIKPKEGMSCIKIDYSANKSRGAGWAGVYWQEPANNWGVEKKGFDLTGAKKLIFYARGERGGEVVDAFKVGGITGTYPDSSESSIGPIMLTKKWEKYTIDLKNKDLSHIIGGFMFVLSAESNPDGMILYIDDIKFEN